MVSNEELAGVVEGSEKFDNGNLAKDACIQEPFCTGVAFKGNVLSEFSMLTYVH